MGAKRVNRTELKAFEESSRTRAVNEKKNTIAVADKGNGAFQLELFKLRMKIEGYSLEMLVCYIVIRIQ